MMCLFGHLKVFPQHNISFSPPDFLPCVDVVGLLRQGSIWADNLCVANTLYPEEVVEELQEPFCAPEVRENAACGCTDEPQPVCDSLWTEIASSPCLADCLGYKEWQPCVNQFQPLIAPPENNGVIELPPGTDNETASDRSPLPDPLPPIEPADSAASTTSWVSSGPLSQSTPFSTFVAMHQRSSVIIC
jgi:hypothetical protein